MTPSANADADADAGASPDARRTGEENGNDAERGSAEATRVRLSFRAPGVPVDADEWPLAGDERLRDRLRADAFLTYLRRVHAGPVAAGQEFEEFVGTGCGRATDVLLRVEAVEGGDRVGSDTVFDVAHRSAV